MKPAWLDKHPCDGCGTGYLECAQWARHNSKCCADCAHPSRWSDDPPYTAAELAAMRAPDEVNEAQQ